MVKVGFIVEGDTEQLLVESQEFRSWASNIGVEVVDPVINARGGGNLLPEYIENHLAKLQSVFPDKILVLTDLENEDCIRKVLDRTAHSGVDKTVVAVKAVEAWFLADTKALCSWAKKTIPQETNPEQTPAMPWDRLKSLATEHDFRGPGPSKPVFARKFLKNDGYSIVASANHPNCPSAARLVRVLSEWGSTD